MAFEKDKTPLSEKVKGICARLKNYYVEQTDEHRKAVRERVAAEKHNKALKERFEASKLRTESVRLEATLLAQEEEELAKTSMYTKHVKAKNATMERKLTPPSPQEEDLGY